MFAYFFLSGKFLRISQDNAIITLLCVLRVIIARKIVSFFRPVCVFSFCCLREGLWERPNIKYMKLSLCRTL